ncbi:MAG: TetR/AcrR family transcriptional regulator [Acidimicrobiales bacterium]
MSVADTQPVVGGRLARSQADRRARVIAAALELGEERGHPDLIQMKDIAERSGVALGTIYRYFSAKDRVLAAALASWATQLEAEVAQRPPKGSTSAERVVAVVRRATRAIERQPDLARTLFLSFSSHRVPGVERDLMSGMARLLASSSGDVDEDVQRGLIRVLPHIWYSGLMGWVNGWRDIRELGDDLEFVCRWLLSGSPPAPRRTIDKIRS